MAVGSRMSRTFFSFWIVPVVLLCIAVHHTAYGDLTSLAKNDPYPTFSAVDPVVERFLITRQIHHLRDEEIFVDRRDRLLFSVSPFGQFADKGRNLQGEAIFRRVPVQLGDLIGRWSAVGLLYGNIPNGEFRAPSIEQARDVLFPAFIGNPAAPINDGSKIDPNQRAGFFTIPIEYRKIGVRFSFSVALGCGFGVNFEGGVASISQRVRHTDQPFCKAPVCTDLVTTVTPFTCLDFQFLDLTNFVPPTGTEDIPDDQEFQFMDPFTKENVINSLTSQFAKIAREIRLDINDFCQISAEELRVNLFWVKVLEYYRDSYIWPHMAIIPYFMLSGSFSPGRQKDEHKAFAVYFGNNKHAALGGSAGVSLDFAETIQVGAEVGYTHFFKHNYFDLRVPTSRFQSGVFPYFTNASIRPGGNTHFALRMLAYHFFYNLSLHLHYHIVDHKPDTIELATHDPAFFPDELEKTTGWRNQSINVGATYDILPNFGVGMLWQAPVIQRNSYRSTTIMFTVYAFF